VQILTGNVTEAGLSLVCGSRKHSDEAATRVGARQGWARGRRVDLARLPAIELGSDFAWLEREVVRF
jgi:hypothetical protein